jgi:hypothetical protein
MIGMDMHRHYRMDFFYGRRLAGVDQRPQIALIDPPLVYVVLPPSTTCHTRRPYVVDGGEDHDSHVGGHYAYTWRYHWWTTCKQFALRVSVPEHHVMLLNMRVQAYTDMPPWAQPCRNCVPREAKKRLARQR